MRGRFGPRTAEDNEKSRQGHLRRRAQERIANEDRQAKVCTKCKRLKPFSDYSPGLGMNGLYSRCKPCAVVKSSGYNKLNPERRNANEKRYTATELGRLRDVRAQCRRAGLTLEVRQAIHDRQDGRCAACRTEIPLMSRKSHIDHCHATGAFRGLLCHACNAALGYAKDSPLRLLDLISYLENNGAHIRDLIPNQ